MEKERKPRPDTLENAEGTATQEGSGKAWDGADWKAGGTEDADRPNSL